MSIETRIVCTCDTCGAEIKAGKPGFVLTDSMYTVDTEQPEAVGSLLIGDGVKGYNYYCYDCILNAMNESMNEVTPPKPRRKRALKIEPEPVKPTTKRTVIGGIEYFNGKRYGDLTPEEKAIVNNQEGE